MDGWGTEALSPTAASSTFPYLGHTAGFHRAGARALPTGCLDLTELQLVIKHLGSFLNMKVKPTVGGDLGEGRTTLSGGGDGWWYSVVVVTEVVLVLAVMRAGDSEAGSGRWLKACWQV